MFKKEISYGRNLGKTSGDTPKIKTSSSNSKNSRDYAFGGYNRGRMDNILEQQRREQEQELKDVAHGHNAGGGLKGGMESGEQSGDELQLTEDRIHEINDLIEKTLKSDGDALYFHEMNKEYLKALSNELSKQLPTEEDLSHAISYLEDHKDKDKPAVKALYDLLSQIDTDRQPDNGSEEN